MIHLFTAGFGFLFGILVTTAAFPHLGLFAEMPEARTMSGVITEIDTSTKRAVLATERGVKFLFSYHDIQPAFLRVESSEDGDTVYPGTNKSLVIGTSLTLRFEHDTHFSATRILARATSL